MVAVMDMKLHQLQITKEGAGGQMNLSAPSRQFFDSLHRKFLFDVGARTEPTIPKSQP